MAGFTLSPSMNLPVPIAGVESGPQYALDIADCMSLIDTHDHSTGNGVPITPAGLNLSSDVTFNNHNIVDARSVRMDDQGAVFTAPADILATYVVGDDLYFSDGVGRQVRITQSGSVAGTPGSIGGLVSPASAFYDVTTTKFRWQSDTNKAALMDCASVIIRKTTISSAGLTLSRPTAGGDYELTLPIKPPSLNSFVALDPAGVFTAAVPLAAGIDLSMLAAEVVNNLVPAGSILAFGGVAAPARYLICDGSSVLRAGTYADLFAAIGTAYGTADGTHFNLPDLRGRFARGTDSGAGHDPNAAGRIASNAGGATGDNVGSYQADEFGSHSHGYDVGLSPTANGRAGLWSEPLTNSNYFTYAAGGSETRPKNVNVNYIIKF
jgi:microcystin-dependent protein